jgi:DNA-binding transcriptional LysR family regulator
MMLKLSFIESDGPMDPRTLDLQALRIFKAVADEASVTRAAARLHYVQSNVTTRLRQLESELGVLLFHRAGGRLVITPAGVKLRGYADRLLRLAQEAKRSVASDGVPRGPLAIGSMETTAAARLPRLLAGFHTRYPEVELVIETGPTDHLVQRVVDFRLDAALVGGPVEQPALESRPVFEEELALITGKRHGPVASPGDVADSMLLVFRTGCTYRRRLERWFESGGVTPRRTLEFGTFEGIVGCVAAGMGVSLMPRAILEQRDLRKSVGVHAIPARLAKVQTVMVWRRDAEPLAAREAFLVALQSKDAERKAGVTPLVDSRSGSVGGRAR